MPVLTLGPSTSSSQLLGVAIPAQFGASDPGSSRLVYAMVVGLAVVGIAFVVLGAWLIRQTRRDLDVLAPLELMGDADWARLDPAAQLRALDAARPAGATPLRFVASLPRFDADFDLDPPLTALSDLGPGIGSSTGETNGEAADETSSDTADETSSDTADETSSDTADETGCTTNSGPTEEVSGDPTPVDVDPSAVVPERPPQP